MLRSLIGRNSIFIVGIDQLSALIMLISTNSGIVSILYVLSICLFVNGPFLYFYILASFIAAVKGMQYYIQAFVYTSS